LDGVLAVPPVDEYDELDAARTPVLEDCVEGSPSRTPRKHDVVDEDDIPVGHVDVVRWGRRGIETGPIIPKGRHVEIVGLNFRLFHGADLLRHGAGDRDAASLNAKELDRVGPSVSFDDLVGQTSERAPDSLGRHDACATHLGLAGI
jgi:hypothetical protein